MIAFVFEVNAASSSLGSIFQPFAERQLSSDCKILDWNLRVQSLDSNLQNYSLKDGLKFKTNLTGLSGMPTGTPPTKLIIFS
jgi:hypothetical protein